MQPVGPCYFVIFGATGNLASEKLIPSLYHLEAAGRINPELRFIAFARRDWSQDDWKEHMLLSLNDRFGGKFDPAIGDRLIERFENGDPVAFQAHEICHRKTGGP